MPEEKWTPEMEAELTLLIGAAIKADEDDDYYIERDENPKEPQSERDYVRSVFHSRRGI